MTTDNVLDADNQQETLLVPYYFSGFSTGEISCCLLRLSNRRSKKGGIYYSPDITISNADYELLQKVNRALAENCGVITKIKGGYNLSFRGKIKVKKVLSFFDIYPPIVGDLVLSRLALINEAVEILSSRHSYRRLTTTETRLEVIRAKLSYLKKTAVPIKNYSQKIFNLDAIGYFLSGVMDAEGSVGLKTNGAHKQPFFAIAMKDKRVVELFRNFLRMGHIHMRPKEKMSHFEIGAKAEVRKALYIFLYRYPSQLKKNRMRMFELKRILNDYTLESGLKNWI